ncbi:MAG: hypothetical protein SPL02_01560 [Bacilli bacterium]|nr:hypothetical protein [Bacilli bacterium]MDY6430645.1 hypothetical protein [Bacilli bacterium]
MRRFVSYLALCGVMLLGVGISVKPVVTSMNTDVAYSDGKTLYFKASSYDVTKQEETCVGGYTDFLTEYDYTDNGQLAIEYLSDVVTSRLNTWKMSEYKVEIEGYDTIKVTLRAANNSAITYEYLEKYLSFSGQDYELDVTAIADKDNDPTKETWKTMIDGNEAAIEYIEQSGYSIPVVVIGVNSECVSDFLELVKYCDEHTTEENQETGEPGKSTNIVVWANRAPDDTYEQASKDANVASRVLKIQTTANDNAVWYRTAKEKEEKSSPHLQLVPESSALTANGYDPSKGKEAYEAAVFLRNMINASRLGNSEKQQFMLNYTYTMDAPASVEKLISTTSILTLSMSKTLISTIVVFALIALILCLFDRLLGVAELTAVTGVAFLSLLLFTCFGAQFNIATLLGVAVAGILGAFGSILYSHKLKNEIYKGRTLKKAHIEASRRSMLPIVDAGIVSILVGIFIYAFTGDIVSKLGLMMIIGGAISILWNLIITRMLGWLVCNDNTVNNKFASYLNINKEKIPNLLKDEKQTYFGPYEGKNFQKGKKILGVFTGAVMIAGIVCLAVFGAKNGGDPYNDAALKQTSTVLRLDVKSTEQGKISIQQFESEDKLLNSQGDYSDIFHNIKVNDKVFADNVKEITLSELSHPVFDSSDGENGTTYYYFYYSITLKKSYDLNKNDYKFDYGSDGQYNKHLIGSLDDAFENIFLEDVYGDSTAYAVEFATINPKVGAPYLKDLAIGLSIGLAVAAVYMMLRYRLSRGLTASLLSFVAGFTGMAFFVITRISVTPIFPIGAIAAALLTLVASIYILNEEKELFKESHERDKTSFSRRSENLIRANSTAAAPYLFFTLLIFYIGIILFGLGTIEYSYVYLSLIIGGLFGVSLILVCMTPMSIFIAKYLAKIKFKPLKKKKAKRKGGDLMKKKKGAEPEEAIFIGIND